jgi:hypothetical protein
MPNLTGLAAYGYYPPGRGVVMSDGNSAVLARPEGTGIRLTLTNSDGPVDVAVRLTDFNLPEVYVAEAGADDIQLIGAGTTWSAGSSPFALAYSSDEDLSVDHQAFVVTNAADDTASIIQIDGAGLIADVPVGHRPARVAVGPVLRALFRFLPYRLDLRFADLKPILSVIKIRNDGAASMIPSRPTLEGSSRFALASDGCSGKKLQPGASCSFVVSFTAADLKTTYKSTLTFSSDDPKVRGVLPLQASPGK